MPKLILLNGPPAVGKSMLARRYADEHPLTLVLEIDTVRALLGAWLEEWKRSGHTARLIALAMARTHLETGQDVIVPQLLVRRGFVDTLRTVTEGLGARFIEIALLDERQATLDRQAQRDEPTGSFSSRALMAKQGNTPDETYDAFVAALRERPDAIVIEDPLSDRAYHRLLELLA